MSQQAIDEMLLRTWDDQELSRSERRALAGLVEVPPDTRLFARHRSFALARRFAAEAGIDKALAWLEEVQKALTEPPPAAAARAEAYFAPHQEVHRHVIAALDATRTRADLAVFTITDDRIAAAVLAAHARNVALRIVTDNDKANDLGSDIERFARKGIAVRIDRTPVHMHHKFAIFDQRRLLTGSYNWTRSANDENAENIILTEDRDLVQAFVGEFEHCWGLADPY